MAIKNYRLKLQKHSSMFLVYVLLIAGSMVAIMPLLYMIANALKTYGETVTRVSPYFWTPEFWAREAQWINFQIVLDESNMALYFRNSVIIAAITVSGILLISSHAAYGFSKLNFPGKNTIFTIMLLTLMIPETVLLIPNFLLITSPLLNWIGVLGKLTIPFMGSMFFIFLLRQFFSQVPDSLIESAVIDGAGHFTILYRIMMPLNKAPLFTVSFLAFNGSWNALQWPLIITRNDTWRPITVGLIKFMSEAGPETHLRMAGALIALFPVVLVYIIAQSQITEAIAKTGLKG
jgi:ABC-type glycerol-3-phosphate transport system permease component